MTFKSNWEKTDTHSEIGDVTIKKIVKDSIPNKGLLSYTTISGGCANLNIKLNFQNDSKPLILRVYMRDPDAGHREAKLSSLIKEIKGTKGSIPVPQYYQIGEVDGYRFALVEFMNGISLRDFLLSNPAPELSDMKAVMIEAGEILGAIQSFTFPHSGFFDRDLKIKTPIDAEGYVSFAQKCLKSPTVIRQLGNEKITTIQGVLQKFGHLLPDGSHAHLVHADFDPANILVSRSGNRWKISAVLDWEFAFSGSWLCDVANMLRYSHEVSLDFEKSFLQGLKKAGLTLPPAWQLTVHMLNLISLLDCLARNASKEHPNQYADISRLIDHILGAVRAETRGKIE